MDLMPSLSLPDAQSMADELSRAIDERRDRSGRLRREEAVSVIRRHIARYHAEIRTLFEARHEKGVIVASTLSALMDGVLSNLYALAYQDSGTQNRGLCLCATGGYGHGLLAPYSDIDLLFLTQESLSQSVTAQIEYILYFLWDLGIRVGHATRSVKGCLIAARDDITIRTTLLDTRRIAGDDQLFTHLRVAFEKDMSSDRVERFISDTLSERAKRHRMYGENPFIVEPNIKEGCGGLRDLQALNWIIRMVRAIERPSLFLEKTPALAPFSSVATLREQERKRADRAWNFLWTIRLHLHYIAGRADERLIFETQPVIGARMGYAGHGRQQGVERFMRHYFLTVREITRLDHLLAPNFLDRITQNAHRRRINKTVKTELDTLGLTLIDQQIAPRDPAMFAQIPSRLFDMLALARRSGLALHSTALQTLIRNERHAASLRNDRATMKIFLELLLQPYEENHDKLPHCGADWLHILNETGLIGALFPDWSRIVGQMQFDTYHIYTVDEHSIETIRILSLIEAGKMADELPLVYVLARENQSRRALFTATLLHDIAKGRGGDHSSLGSEIASRICVCLGLDAEETETVSWLVLHHLLLAQTAFQRDIDDPRTILDLADIIQSPERLRLLLLLTVADIRAVNATVWNAWKATLLRELYARIAEVLEGGLASTEHDERVLYSKSLVTEGLCKRGLPAERIERFTARSFGSYWLGFDSATHIRHESFVYETERHRSSLAIETTPLTSRAVTEITVFCPDHPGLFTQIVGGVAVAGASIVDARIHTFRDGSALDTFWVQNAVGKLFESPSQLARLNALIAQSINGELDVRAALAENTSVRAQRRMRAIHVPPRVVFYNRVSDIHTVIEINGKDRPALLYDIAQCLRSEVLQIHSAHIMTYGMRAVDVFYVSDAKGKKITDVKRTDALREALLRTLAASDSNALTAPRPS